MNHALGGLRGVLGACPLSIKALACSAPERILQNLDRSFSPLHTNSPIFMAMQLAVDLNTTPISKHHPPTPEVRSRPYSPSITYTFILLRETLASATALTEKGKIAMENFITLNMAITLNA